MKDGDSITCKLWYGKFFKSIAFPSNYKYYNYEIGLFYKKRILSEKWMHSAFWWMDKKRMKNEF
jgi:hypothetical protein